MPKDNKYNTKAYIDSLEYLPMAEYERYVRGNWEYDDDPNQLVLYEWYKSCIRLEALNKEYYLTKTKRRPKYLGIDHAREGNDKTVLCYGDDQGPMWFEEFYKKKSAELAPIIKLRMQEFKIKPGYVEVDEIGTGGGLIDCLELIGVYISGFKSTYGNTTIIPHFTLKNRRAEAHWLWRKDIENCDIELPNCPELQKQTLVLKYFIDAKCIQIEDKKLIKKRLTYSPDYAESAIIMNFIRRMAGGGAVLISGSDKQARSESNVRFRDVNTLVAANASGFNIAIPRGRTAVHAMEW